VPAAHAEIADRVRALVPGVPSEFELPNVTVAHRTHLE